MRFEKDKSEKQPITALLTGIIGGFLAAAVGTGFAAVEISQTSDKAIKIIDGFPTGAPMGSALTLDKKNPKSNNAWKSAKKYHCRIGEVISNSRLSAS